MLAKRSERSFARSDEMIAFIIGELNQVNSVRPSRLDELFGATVRLNPLEVALAHSGCPRCDLPQPLIKRFGVQNAPL